MPSADLPQYCNFKTISIVSASDWKCLVVRLYAKSVSCDTLIRCLSCCFVESWLHYLRVVCVRVAVIVVSVELVVNLVVRDRGTDRTTTAVFYRDLHSDLYLSNSCICFWMTLFFRMTSVLLTDILLEQVHIASRRSMHLDHTAFQLDQSALSR